MLSIRGLVRLRKMLGISSEDIAKEMCTTRQTIHNIEHEKTDNSMSIKFYSITIINIIKNMDNDFKEDLKNDLRNMLQCLEEA